MDRFIEFTKNTTAIVLIDLKSNMDRFIAEDGVRMMCNRYEI